MLAILLGLGTWQVHRLAWKRGLIDAIARAEASAPTALPAAPAPFEKVAVRGRFRDDLAAIYGAEGRETSAGPVLGGQLIVPLERADGDLVLVDRGWVPDPPPSPIATPAGETEVIGYVRQAERPHWFSPNDNPATRHFYTLDPASIGADLGLPRVAPFTLVALGAPTPGVYPEPAEHLPRPPNDHLQYAITWYGLAAVLVVVFGSYLRKVLWT
jgi:surfeit locus 1 family protein